MRTQYSIGTREVIIKRTLDGRVAVLLGKSVQEVSQVTAALLHEVIDALVDGYEVRLDGLGYLHVFQQKGRRATTSVLRSNSSDRRAGDTQNLVAVEVSRKFCVSFRKGRRIKEKLEARYGTLEARKINMDKLGVVEDTDDETLEKKAAQGCPKCGDKVEVHGQLLVCPTHGTEPFETKKDG